MVYTVKDIQAHLQIGEKTVLKLIGSGALKAFSVGLGKRAEWRITEEALQEFIAARSVVQPAPPRRRTRFVKPPQYV